MRFVGGREEGGGGYDDGLYIRLGNGILSCVQIWTGSMEEREEGTVAEQTS